MKRILMTVACAVAFAANADTVAWWHFDELADGVKATQGTAPFLNSVDPTKHAGLARATPLYDGDWRTDSSYLPQGVAAFPEGAKYYDPVSGQQSENSLGVAFSALGGSRQTGGAIVIPYNSELCPHNCTYEFFFKPEPTLAHGTQHLVFTRDQEANAPTNCGVRVRYTANSGGTDGTMGLDIYERGPNGFSTNHTAIESGNIGGVGKWHHVAFTMDNDARKAQFFVDYALIGSVTLVGDCSQSTKDYVLGNSKAGWGAYEGCIDEFRISDRVLNPGEFLAVTDDGPALMLPETVVYQRFRAFPDFFGAGDGLTNRALTVMNEAAGDGWLGQPTVAIFGDGFFPIDDVPVANVLTGKVGNVLSANRSALSCRSTAESRTDNGSLPKASPCWTFADARAAVSTNDVTAEMFFRTTNVAYATYFFCLGNPAYLVMARGSNAGINVNGTPVVNESISDGRWHHLALVANETTGMAQLYLDYIPCGDPVARGTPASGKSYEQCIGVGCYGANRFVTFFDVDFDDVRITRKKLDVDEFLHFAKTDDVIANWNLDQTDPDFAQRWIERWNIATSWTQPAGTSVTYDQSDKPGSEVADGLFGERTTNVSALHIAGGSNSTGTGYYTLESDAIAGLPSDSFTVELEAKLPRGDFSNYWGTAAYIVFLPTADNSNPLFYINFMPYKKDGSSSAYSNAGSLAFSLGYTAFATCSSSWMDGGWHHIAFVYDKDRQEVRAYLDHALLGKKNDVALATTASTKFYLGSGKWGSSLGLHSWRLDNFRITKKALKPCEFKTSQFLSGNTLVWAPFDRGGDLISEIGLKAAFSGSAWDFGAGRIEDALGNVIRERNRGAFLASPGAGAYSRLSLIELPDVSVEFFVKCTGAVANDTDLVKLTGDDGNPIWSIRKKSDGKMHVMAKPQGGSLTDLGGFADVPNDWRHVAVTFVPSADGASTSVSFYLDYNRVGEPVAFNGTLAVDGLADSSLACGSFAGSIDELRITKGALSVADMLRATRLGTIMIVW